MAKDNGLDPVSLAIAWVMFHSGVTAPIIGARNLDQLEGGLKSIEVEMNDDLYLQVGALFPEPPLAHDRREEQKNV